MDDFYDLVVGELDKQLSETIKESFCDLTVEELYFIRSCIDELIQEKEAVNTAS